MNANRSSPIISLRGINKTHAGGFQALKSIDLDIERGEIFALLGPNGTGMNIHGIRAICRLEMARTFRTLAQSIAAPVLTTSLYFIVFGKAISGRLGEIDSIGYGAFYSIDMLPSLWKNVTLFNPMVYLISGFRWSFYGIADVDVGISIGMTLGFMMVCLAYVWWVFKTGYKIRN